MKKENTYKYAREVHPKVLRLTLEEIAEKFKVDNVEIVK